MASLSPLVAAAALFDACSRPSDDPSPPAANDDWEPAETQTLELDIGMNTRASHVVNFGKVHVGKTSTRIMTLVNKANSPIYIKTWRYDWGDLWTTEFSSGTETSWNHDHCTGAVVEPKGRCLIAVRFTPAVGGRFVVGTFGADFELRPEGGVPVETPPEEDAGDVDAGDESDAGDEDAGDAADAGRTASVLVTLRGEELASQRLTVFPTGSGSGQVTYNGSTCPPACNTTFGVGSPDGSATKVITLTPKASNNATFLSWGDDCADASKKSCVIRMDAPKRVSVRFADKEAGTE